MKLIVRTIYSNALIDEDLNCFENIINQLGGKTTKKIIRNYWKFKDNKEFCIEFSANQDSIILIKNLYKMRVGQSEKIITQNDIDPSIYKNSALWSHIEFIE